MCVREREREREIAHPLHLSSQTYFQHVEVRKKKNTHLEQ